MNIRETSDVDHYMQYLNLPVALSRGPVVMEEAEVADCPPVVFLKKGVPRQTVLNAVTHTKVSEEYATPTLKAHRWAQRYASAWGSALQRQLSPMSAQHAPAHTGTMISRVELLLLF